MREVSSAVAFSPPWPSPAHGSVHLSYVLPRSSRVSQSIHDVAGRLARQVSSDEWMPSGRHDTVWNGEAARGPAAAGIYLARLVVNGASYERRFAWTP